MKYKKGTRRRAAEYEPELVKYWNKHQTFEKSISQRPATDAYVFYDGPPFITGVPHHGTLLSSIVKDAVPRYWTMKGKRVERVWGWDCHGLPAEVFTEKKLGIKDKRDIGTKVSLEDYITTCRENMIQTGSEWEDIISRIGRWVDFKGAYRTMDKEYMESVWWAFKRLYESGKIYEGEKVLLYCTRDATPISKSEVAMDNSYQDVTDPSVYVKLKLVDRDAYLLAWTTTPWTLPANTAAAVNQTLMYADVQVKEEVFIVAADMVEKVFKSDKNNVIDYTILKKYRGSEIIGQQYEPLFEQHGKTAHKVWSADYVNTDEGTGVVHLAPAYGEEDYLLAKQEGFPYVSVIDDNGFYTEGEWVGQQMWEANKTIAKALHERGVVWKIDYIQHSYPHCHRCGTKLMYRAHPSWFMDIEGQREQMLKFNGDNINWFPEHIKQGRFAKTVESAPDWNLSRDRFWATAMPVWKGVDKNGKEHVKVIGSYQELQQLSGVILEDYHRPWIDDVTFTENNIYYKRIDKVLDCWFESGSMPFAQFHYPFENVSKFEENFPGDFIAEYVGQVRAWFYYLHVVSVGLFQKNSFSNVIVTGTLAGNDGRKMSKSFGNFTDPNELMDKYSADSLRYLLLSSPVLNGEDFALQDKDVGDVARKLSMVWNMYDFFTLYAEVDQWEWQGELTDPTTELTNELDIWIISRLHELTKEVGSYMNGYDIPNAVKPILPFIDDASNWYVRRSRRRFWRSGRLDDESQSDKQAAYRTLHYVLVQLSMVMAPFTPFLAEELYQKLTGGESVHLLDWPKVGHINELAVKDMQFVREIITQGLAQRAQASIKVRQPLQSVNVYDAAKRLTTQFMDIICEELNVKQVIVRTNQAIEPSDSVYKSWTERDKPFPAVIIDLDLTPKLLQEGLMREVVRNVQHTRKQANLAIDDRIELWIETVQNSNTKVSTLNTLLSKQHDLTDIIQSETLAVSLNNNRKPEKFDKNSFTTTVTVEGQQLIITLLKVQR